MIIYMYLAILIVTSIITGIITTIADKKKKISKNMNSKISKVSFPSKVAIQKRHIYDTDRVYSSIPIIDQDKTFIEKTVELFGLTRKIDAVEIEKDKEVTTVDEPVFLSIIDVDGDVL